MKQLFNPRPIFVGFISLILGIVATVNLVINNSIINIIVFVFACLVLTGLVVALVLGVTKFKFPKIKILVLVFGIICLAFGGIIGSAVITKPVTQYSGEVNVSGRVTNIKIYNSVYVLQLDKVKIEDTKTSFDLELVVFARGNNFNIVTGNTITGSVDISTILNSSQNMYYIANNLRYKATSNLEQISSDNSVGWKYVIKHKVKDNLEKFLNPTNADIAYSIIFGEKENMSNDTYKVFSYSGIAHILAVSGLHIGFLVTMLLLIFKLFKFNQHISNGVMIAILFCYASLCDFTPSVTRAIIMSIVLIIAKTYSFQYDGLNSISVAGLSILLFSPLSIYLVGFQLSFLCVFSILVFANSFTNQFVKMKVPKKIANSVAISLAVNIGVACVMLQNFKQLSLISILSNMVVLPIFSICFSTMFLVLFLGLLIPVVNYLLIVPNVLLHFIRLIANVFCDINIVNFEVMHFSYILVVMALIASYIYHFALTKISIRRIICITTAVVIIAVTFAINIPLHFKNDYCMVGVDSVGNYACIINNDKRTLIINDLYNSEDIIEDLNNARINHIDNLVISKYSVKQKSMVNELVSKYNIKVLYVDNYLENSIYSSFSKNVFVKTISENINVDNINIQFLNSVNDNFGVQVDFGNYKLLILNTNVTLSKINLYVDKSHYDYIILSKSLNLDDDIDCDCIINRNNIDNYKDKNILSLDFN